VQNARGAFQVGVLRFQALEFCRYLRSPRLVCQECGHLQQLSPVSDRARDLFQASFQLLLQAGGDAV
jgi:hypothetical protein